MYEAAAGERDHLRLQRPPVRERPRPLSRPRYLVHLLARENHAAVDDPRDDRRELLRGHGEHAFVEEREAVAHPTVLDQHVALGMDREREEVAIAETLAELDRLFGDRRRRGEIPGRLLLEDARVGAGSRARRTRPPWQRVAGRGRASPSRGRSRPGWRGSGRSRRRSERREGSLRRRGDADVPPRATRRSRRRDPA